MQCMRYGLIIIIIITLFSYLRLVLTDHGLDAVISFSNRFHSRSYSIATSSSSSSSPSPSPSPSSSSSSLLLLLVFAELVTTELQSAGTQISHYPSNQLVLRALITCAQRVRNYCTGKELLLYYRLAQKTGHGQSKCANLLLPTTLMDVTCT